MTADNQVTVASDNLLEMADQYDLSPAEKQILIEKAQRREVLRNEFLKQASNPHRHASMEGGAVVSACI